MVTSINWKEVFRIVGISFAGSLGLTYFTCVSCRSNAGHYALITFFSFCLWISLWIGNNSLTHYLNRKISWVEFPVRRLVIGVLTTVIYTVSAVSSIILLWERFSYFDIGSYYWTISFSLIITFLISLFLHGREFLIRWKKSAVEAERLQKESVRAQYESLKNQVNPHFLFNSLNALSHLVYEDQD